ncbi:DUF4097 family beta strand repeat-containing protein [Bacillus coreaensis]
MKEERKRILQMVEEGKLKVDEALLLLEELEKSNTSMEEKQQKLYNELSTVVNFEEGKKSSGFSYQKAQSAKEKILEFVDVAFKKIKDFDLDWNFGQSVDVSHIYQQTHARVKDIDIDVANGSVTLIPWNQSDVRVECEAKVYRVESPEEAKSLFIKDVLFSVEGDKLRFGAQQKWMKVQAKVYVPSTDFEHIRIRMFNGPITSENLVVASFKAKTANGKVDVSNIKASKAELETANGQISVQQSQIVDFEGETINGAIRVDGTYKKLDLQSFNGNIECELAGDQCDVVVTKATTGSIKVKVPTSWALSGELKSNLGGFQVDVDDISVVENKSEVVQKMFTFKSTRPLDTFTTILADTKTGSISLKKVK